MKPQVQNVNALIAWMYVFECIKLVGSKRAYKDAAFSQLSYDLGKHYPVEFESLICMLGAIRAFKGVK